jgi:hypothetical protein
MRPQRVVGAILGTRMSPARLERVTYCLSHRIRRFAGSITGSVVPLGPTRIAGSGCRTAAHVAQKREHPANLAGIG